MKQAAAVTALVLMVMCAHPLAEWVAGSAILSTLLAIATITGLVVGVVKVFEL